MILVQSAFTYIITPNDTQIPPAFTLHPIDAPDTIFSVFQHVSPTCHTPVEGYAPHYNSVSYSIITDKIPDYTSMC